MCSPLCMKLFTLQRQQEISMLKNGYQALYISYHCAEKSLLQPVIPEVLLTESTKCNLLSGRHPLAKWDC
jgi:hypothetical protein